MMRLRYALSAAMLVCLTTAVLTAVVAGCTDLKTPVAMGGGFTSSPLPATSPTVVPSTIPANTPAIIPVENPKTVSIIHKSDEIISTVGDVAGTIAVATPGTPVGVVAGIAAGVCVVLASINKVLMVYFTRKRKEN